MKKILFLVYFLFLLGFLFFSYAFVDQNLIYLREFYTGYALLNRQTTVFLYIVLIFLFFIFYFLFLAWFRKKILSSRDLIILIFVTFIILAFSYPAMLSYDIFNYQATARVAFYYRENPYIIMPVEFAGDTQLLFTHAANKIALYGPIWILLTLLPYFLSFGNFIVSLLSFKILVGLFYFGTVFLLLKISKNLSVVYFFALNPLVVIETFVSGHNDIVMMFFALACFYHLLQKKLIKSFVFLFLSVLIKYATVFLLPVWLYWMWMMYVRHQEPNKKEIFYFSGALMFLVFFLSPFRGEMYSWYAVWPITFASFFSQRSSIFYLVTTLSFALLLRYVPFMLLGTHFGLTPTLRIILTITPVFFVFVYLSLRNRLWLKELLRIQ